MSRPMKKLAGFLFATFIAPFIFSICSSIQAVYFLNSSNYCIELREEENEYLEKIFI